MATAALADGQTQTTAPSQTSVFADRILKTSPTTLQYRGAVRIENGTTTITADEADATRTPGQSVQFDLRGNVHLTVSR